MSESIPVFQVGDWVRIMQTDEMHKQGLANRRGQVVMVSETGLGVKVKLRPSRVHPEIIMGFHASTLAHLG